MTTNPSRPELAAELEELRARLTEAEEVLHAIRNGEVDAVVVAGEHGEQVYTLSGADRVYRQLIETMSEGAVTLSADGVILYCNGCLAKMLGRPLDQVLGTALRNHLSPEDQQVLDAILAQARTEPSRRGINLKSSEGHLVPVHLSASRLHSEGAEMVFCLVLTDLTDQKRHEQIVAAERLARLILEQAAEAIVVCDEQGWVIRISQATQRFCDGSPLLRSFAEAFPLRTDASEPFRLAPVLQGGTLRNVDVALDRQGQKFDLILNAGPLLSGQQILGCVVTLTDITKRKRTKEALRESLERFQLANLATFNAIWDWNLQTDALWWNENFQTLFGYRAEEIEPGIESWINRIHPEDLDRVKTGIHAAIDSGQDHWFDQYHFRRKDGMYAEVEDRGYIARDASGHPLRMIGAMQDITERKRTEDVLRESERKFQAIFENAADLILLLEILPDGPPIIRDANGAIFSVLGYERDEIIGKPVHLLDADTNIPELIGERRRKIVSGGTAEFEVKHRCKDGTLLEFECSMTEFTIGPRTFAVSIERDVSERKKAVAALRESEGKYRILSHNIAGMIYKAQPDWSTEIISNSENVCGYTAQDFNSQKVIWTSLIVEEDKERVLDEASQIEEKKISLVQEYRIVAKDGRIRWVEDHKTSVFSDTGVFQGVNGVVFDITQRKHAEEAMRQQTGELRARNEELIHFNRAMVGRELRMIELKQEVNELCRRLSEPPLHAVDLPPGGGGDQ